jgi:hypothetical protein
MSFRIQIEVTYGYFFWATRWQIRRMRDKRKHRYIEIANKNPLRFRVKRDIATNANLFKEFIDCCVAAGIKEFHSNRSVPYELRGKSSGDFSWIAGSDSRGAVQGGLINPR